MKNVWLLFLVGLTSILNRKHVVSSQKSFATADDIYIEEHTSGDLPIDDEDAENDWSGSGSGNFALIDFTEDLNQFLNGTKSAEVEPLQPQSTSVSRLNPYTTAAATREPPNKVKDDETTRGTSSDANRETKVSVVVPKAEPTAQKPSATTTVMPPRKTTAAAESSVDISGTLEPHADNSVERWNIVTTKEEVLIKQVDNDIETQAGRDGRVLDVSSQEEVTSENMWERTEVLAAVIACGVVGFLCAVLLLLLLAYRMKKKDEGSYDLGDTKLSSTAYHKAPTKEFYA